MRLTKIIIPLILLSSMLSGMEFKDFALEENKECVTLHEQPEPTAHSLAHLQLYAPRAVGLPKKVCTEQELEEELKKSSVEKLFVIAHFVNRINGANILHPALKALTHQLRSERKQLLHEDALHDPLPRDLRSFVLNDSDALKARISLLLKKKELPGNKPLLVKGKDTSGPIATQSNLLASASNTHIRVWDLTTGAERDCLEGHSNKILSMMFSASGKLLISSDGAKIKIWQINIGKCIQTFGQNLFMPKAIAPSEKCFACAKNSSLYLIDNESGKCLQTFAGHKKSIEDAAFDHTGNYIITCSQDHDAKLWSPNSTMIGALATLKGHESSVTCVGFDASGRKALSGSLDKTVRIWDAQAGKSTQVLSDSGDVHSAAFHPHSTLVATKTPGKTNLWDLNAGIKILTLEDSVDNNSTPQTRYGKAIFNAAGNILVTDDHCGNVTTWDFNPELYESMKKWPAEHKLLLEQLHEDEVTHAQSMPIAPTLLERLSPDLRMIVEARK